jgi:hypothetical protein
MFHFENALKKETKSVAHVGDWRGAVWVVILAMLARFGWALGGWLILLVFHRGA